MPGRCMALADADCALAGQRVTLELLLAAERVRQNGTEAEYVGDRVMEGLIMACLTMNAQASARMQPDGDAGAHHSQSALSSFNAASCSGWRCSICSRCSAVGSPSHHTRQRAVRRPTIFACVGEYSIANAVPGQSWAWQAV